MEPGTTTIHAPCSECGHKPGETASPRWPLWLRTMPWLAVVAVIVLAAGLGLRGLQAPSTWPINEVVYGILLREWPRERLLRATTDPVEALMLRDELLAVADHFADLTEPGAKLRFQTDLPLEPIRRTPPHLFGMPWAWASAHHSAVDRDTSMQRFGTSLIATIGRLQIRFDMAIAAFILVLAMSAAWVCSRLFLAFQRLRGRPALPRMANRARLVVFGISLVAFLMTPTPHRWPNTWDQCWTLFHRSASVDVTLAELTLPDPDGRRSREAGEGLCDFWEWIHRDNRDSPRFLHPVVQWVNTADGTLTTTDFGSPWHLFSYGTSVCDPPSSGAPTTRVGWPEWRYERLVIWAGTRGFPSRAGYVALEPAGIGIWSFFALIAYWLAALTRHLITRTVLRRRQRAGRCQACGYQLSIVKAT